MKNLIDLHIHTNISDGALSPKEVIDEASKNGVSVIAIADHDTIEAYTDELFDYAKSKEITLIPAVEISTKTKKAGIHVLGYNFDIHNQDFKDALASLRNVRHEYLYNVAAKLAELGYVVNVARLDKVDAVTKAHIALDVINNIENEKILLETFNHIPSKGEFIETIMNEGCPAYVRKNTVTPVEAAKIIRKAGGKVVLAHPVAYTYEDNLSDDEILMLAKDMQADGLEAVYLYVNGNNRKINDIDKWIKLAHENNFIVTIGSDFHRHDAIRSKIGLINEDLNLDYSIYKAINKLLFLDNCDIL